MNFDLKVEVNAKGSSSYTIQNVEDRLARLAEVDTDVAREEIKYLEGVKAKLIAKQVQPT